MGSQKPAGARKKSARHTKNVPGARVMCRNGGQRGNLVTEASSALQRT
jgi:hypothetical protein